MFINKNFSQVPSSTTKLRHRNTNKKTCLVIDLQKKNNAVKSVMADFLSLLRHLQL